MRLNDYIPLLMEKRRNEKQRKEEIYESSEGLTSPSGVGSTEEIRIFMDYMKQANLMKISEAAPQKKKFSY